MHDAFVPVCEPARDRARGALLGLAAGDAVGTTVEFKRPGSFTPLTDMVGGGPFGLAAGEWTDDTSLALCLAESLLDRGGHDPSDQMRRYTSWWRDGYFSATGECFDIGISTRQQLARFEATGLPHATDVDEEAAANGSLMRLAPVAVRWSHEPDIVAAQAAASSRPTHPAARPQDACKVLAAMVAAFIRGEPADAVLAPEFWRQGPLHPQVEAVARGSWRTKQPPAIRGTGFCVDALEAAIWAVAGAADFSTAVLRAANLGDDADTTAAIAGQLAGARFGSTGIPAAWLEKLALRQRIESLADGLHRAATGRQTAWQFDDDLHAWWVEPGRLLAGEYPGGDDDVATDQRLALLADAGIETTLDLTSDWDVHRPYGERWSSLGASRDRMLRRLHHPIADMGVIGPRGYDRIVGDIRAELDAARPVFVHCVHGLGRTGTVVGVWLRHAGHDFDAALETIRRARSGTRKARWDAPQTDAQRNIIRQAGG